MVNGTSGWLHQPAQLLTTSPWGIAIMKGDVISIMTTVGSPVRVSTFTVSIRECLHLFSQPNSAHMAVYSPWPGSASTIEFVHIFVHAVVYFIV